METPDDRDFGPEAADLLAAFIGGGRSEAAFQALVDRLGGLVYSSALRRTDSAQLAEEVAQNVFTILARKAGSLTSHPALLAWIFKTTRLEAAKAMRGEDRRRRKLEALSKLTPTESSMSADDEENWREAVPHLDASLDQLSEKDRQIVLQRFYEGRKFKDIAVTNGTTEAASKMRVKRALNKLSRMLSSRGVSLSGAAVATALGSELARSAPAAALSALAPKALAAAGTVGATTATTSTIQIMSTAKVTAATSAAVVALAAAPFIWQQSKAAKMRAEILDLEERRVELEGQTAGRTGAADIVIAPSGAAARTVGDLLADSEKPIDLQELMDAMMEVMLAQDMVGMLKVFIPLTAISQGEYARLMDELENYEGNAQAKQMALQMISTFAPADNPRDALDRMLRLGVETHVYGNLLHQWAAKDADAAIAWFRGKSAEGAFVSKGVHDNAERSMLGQLLGGIAVAEPGRALDLFIEMAGDDPQAAAETSWQLAAGIGRHLGKTGDESQLTRLLEHDNDGSLRDSIIGAAVGTAVPRDDTAAAAAFIGRYIDDPERRRPMIVNHVTNRRELDLEKQMDLLAANLPADQLPEGAYDLVRARYWTDDIAKTRDWLDTQPAGPVRDHAARAVIERMSQPGKLDEAAALAAEIGDETLRAEAQQHVENYRRHFEQASEADGGVPTTTEVIQAFDAAPTSPAETREARAE